MDFSSRQNHTSTCPICRKHFRQVATIEGCSHQFCRNCITRKITEEGLRSCPVCNVDLGRSPLQKLRVETSWPSTQTNFIERRTSPQPIDGDDDQQPKGPLTRSFSRNEKQKYLSQGSSSQTQIGAKNNNHTTEDNLTWTKQIRERVSHVVAKNTTTEPVADDRNHKKDGAFWFALVASDKQKSKAPLEQIPSRYLRVRDGNITVSSIKKYLVQKLNLSSENEVEISMQGHQLPSTLEISKLLNLWVQTSPTSDTTTTKRAFVGCSAEEFVLTLTYGRS